MRSDSSPLCGDEVRNLREPAQSSGSIKQATRRALRDNEGNLGCVRKDEF